MMPTAMWSVYLALMSTKRQLFVVLSFSNRKCGKCYDPVLHHLMCFMLNVWCDLCIWERPGRRSTIQWDLSNRSKWFNRNLSLNTQGMMSGDLSDLLSRSFLNNFFSSTVNHVPTHIIHHTKSTPRITSAFCHEEKLIFNIRTIALSERAWHV